MSRRLLVVAVSCVAVLIVAGGSSPATAHTSPPPLPSNDAVMATGGRATSCPKDRWVVAQRGHKINRIPIPRGSYRVSTQHLTCGKAMFRLRSWVDTGHTARGWKVRSAGGRDRTITFVSTRSSASFVVKRLKNRTKAETWLGRFVPGAIVGDVATENCTLSGGTTTSCSRVTIAGYPSTYEVGPFCPATIATHADHAGIWFDGNGVYDLTGAFVKNLDQFYADSEWRLFDSQGNVNVTDTKEAFAGAARPDVAPEYRNHCVEGRLAWLPDGKPVQTTVRIPQNPIKAAAPSSAHPGNLGITFDGVVIAESAPVEAILGAHTIAAFDDCGGHYNPVAGYHLHGVTGCGHAVGNHVHGETKMFGYASDGFPIHLPLRGAALTAAGLDQCNGHSTAGEGYHYHANGPAKNAVLPCLMGEYVASEAVGGPPPGGPPGATGQSEGVPDLASATASLGAIDHGLADTLPTRGAPSAATSSDSPRAVIAVGASTGAVSGAALDVAGGSGKVCSTSRLFVARRGDSVNGTPIARGSYRLTTHRLTCGQAITRIRSWVDTGHTARGWKVRSAGRSDRTIAFLSTRRAVSFVAKRMRKHASANTWIGPPADITQLPIGTAKVSLERAAVGGLYACDAGSPNGGGAHATGPWIDESAGTWNLTRKVAVQGVVSWPAALYSETLTDGTRDIAGNGLPVHGTTGIFPISPQDPAYSYDRNPNHIATGDVTVSLPRTPTVADTPTCLGKGRVGILKNGVSLFAPLDERNRDAVVYETQDECDGHPQQTSVYHYHDVPSCIRDAATGASTVVGFAADGFPIVVERDARGDLPTNADLDECHGRTSRIRLDGRSTVTYHYSATYEFPYFIGCFRGTPVA